MARDLTFDVTISCGVSLDEDRIATVADALGMKAEDLSDEDIINFIVSEANYEMAFDSDHVVSYSTEITEAERTGDA